MPLTQRDLLHLLTVFGNATMVLPLLASAMLWLSWGPGSTPDSRRAAGRWALLCAGALVLVAASKVSYYAWGTAILAWKLTCFSGHTVAGFVAWPALLALMAPSRWPALRIASAALGLLIAFAIAWSRVANRAHPPSEVIAGIALGLPAALASLHLLWTHQLPRTARLVLAVLLAVLLARGPAIQRHLTTEHMLAHLASTVTGKPAWRLLPK